MKKLILIFALVLSGTAFAQDLTPEEPLQAMEALRAARDRTRTQTSGNTGYEIPKMISLGMWSEAAWRLVKEGTETSPANLLAWVHWSLVNHQYAQAEGYLAQYEAVSPGSLEGMVLRSKLYGQAWLLPAAVAQADQAIAHFPDSLAGYVAKAEALMLQQRYDVAAELATTLQQRFPVSGKGWLLAAEASFWQKDILQAGESLAISLKKEPFDADARFWYGYYLWRKGDAALLPEMTLHWEVALAIHPLHYLTHWHWGNGHTAFTFIDYADPDEEVIRYELAQAERMVANDSMEAALERIKGISDNHFSSAIPDLALGSVYYMHEAMPREVRLDTALAAFQRSLHRKAHYGPAHNGIAAVIKQRQFSYLDAFDSLENAIDAVQIPANTAFDAVFSDLSAYPGSRTRNMVWNQLFTAKAYLPLLEKMGETFHIPPLHQDLALVMDNLYFREATTFDNRQWMDIRGVGSGAAGIEYVERGAHLERNVALHEFIHLIHGSVLTDQEVRRINTLYFQAMKEGRALDYYAESNDFEYFAQAYPAYFSTVKVHPLNHKALGTRSDLLRKDPQMYAFVDSLVQKEQAALQGNGQALIGNWAQAYVQLAASARQISDHYRAGLLLDTALVWQPGYLPAWIGKAGVAWEQQQWPEAQAWLDKAKRAFPNNPDVFAGEAGMAAAMFLAGKTDTDAARTSIQVNLEKAYQAESDPQQKARRAETLWQNYQQFGQVEKAAGFAEAFAYSSPTVSSELRRMVLRAQAATAVEKGRMGYLEEARLFFEPAIVRNPQELYLRMYWALVLSENNLQQEGLNVLQESGELYAASGRMRGEVVAMMAWLWLQTGNVSEARQLLEPMRDGAFSRSGDPFLWVRIYLEMNDLDMANQLLTLQEEVRYPRQLAEYFYLKGLLLQETGDRYGAMNAWTSCLEENPYHLNARLDLLEALKALGDTKSVKKIAGKGLLLPLPPGGEFQVKLQAFDTWSDEKP